MNTKCISLKWSLDCSNCGDTLPVNKAAEEILCNNCGEISYIPQVLWQKLVTPQLMDAASMKEETDSYANGMMGGVGSYAMRFGNMQPRCENGCCSIFSVDDILAIANDGENNFSCTTCGKIISVRKAPDFFNTVIPNATYIIGEEAPLAQGKIEGTGDGISIRCYHCGGQLKLDGSSRKVNCEYCSNDLLIPDDIWQRLNPVIVAHYWYIVLNMENMQEFLPFEIDEFLDLEVDKHGNTICLWEQDDKGHIGLTDRSGGFLWHVKKIEVSDYARLLYDANHDLVWVIHYEEHICHCLNATNGEKIKTINQKNENEDIITAKDHEGIAICTDGSIVIYRPWGEDDKPLKTLTKKFLLGENILARFDHTGKRIPLWQGKQDTELTYEEDIYFEDMSDYTSSIPEDSWIMGGPDNTLYVINRETGYMLCYDRSGKIIKTIDANLEHVELIQDCAVSQDGTIFVVFDHEEEVNDMNYSHVGKISPKGKFDILAGPLHGAYSFPIGTDMSLIAVSQLGDIHLIDYDFNNFRILASDGTVLWRNFGTIQEDETRLEDFEEDKNA